MRNYIVMGGQYGHMVTGHYRTATPEEARALFQKKVAAAQVHKSNVCKPGDETIMEANHKLRFRGHGYFHNIPPYYGY